MEVTSITGKNNLPEVTKSAEVSKKAAPKNAVPEKEKAAVYEKSSESHKEPYKIAKMSKEERTALVEKMKEDQRARQEQLMALVTNMLNGQGKAVSIATNDDSLWKVLAKGDFTVDAVTKKQAQEDISEDGYWGVKQTSQRMFDFALALSGGDKDKMKSMQAAMEKGYKQATAAWGRKMPDITKQTMEAANKLFDDYYKSDAANEISRNAKVTENAAANLNTQAAAHTIVNK